MSQLETLIFLVVVVWAMQTLLKTGCLGRAWQLRKASLGGSDGVAWSACQWWRAKKTPLRRFAIQMVCREQVGEAIDSKFAVLSEDWARLD